MADTSIINKALYSGADFDTIFDDIQARIQAKYGDVYNDFVVSSEGVMLIDVISNALATLSFYLDRRASDLYLDTARTVKSVTKLSRQLGYKLAPSSASSTDLLVQTTQAYNFPITIPKGFQFLGPTGLIFEAAQDTVIPIKSTAPVEVPVYEGQTINESFVSTGTPSQTFNLRAVPVDKFIVAGTVKVLVDGVAFEESDFLEVGNSNIFEVSYSDSPPVLKFGDGILGAIPSTSASIAVTYVASRGVLGQVASNSIISVVNPLVASANTISLVLTNPQPSTGGAAPEPPVNAKIQAGKVFKSRKKAITQSDYEAIAGSYADPVYGRVAVAHAVPTRNSSGDIEIQNQAAIINTAVSFKPAVDASIASATTKLSKIDTDLVNLNTQLSNTAQLIGALKTTDLKDAQSLMRTAQKTQMDMLPLVNGSSVGVIDIANQAVGAINDIVTGSQSRLTVLDKDALIAYVNRLSSQSAIVSNTVNNVLNQMNVVLGKVSNAISKTEVIGTDLTTPNTSLYTAAQMSADIGINAGISPSTGVRGDLAAINTVVLDVTATVAEALAAIAAHVDRVISVDSKANLITVPILTKNFAGFYAPPSTGLLRSLQTYLDARKEVTQTIQVVSGAESLVAAAITVRLGVLPGFSQSVLAKTAATLVDGVLLDRTFAKSLFTSEITPVLSKIQGVGFVNVTINGYLQDPENINSLVLVTKSDATGNLIVQSGEVVTKGFVVINPEQME